MPDIVVVRIPKEDQPSEGLLPALLPQPPDAPKPPLPKSPLTKLWRLLFFPVRIVRALLMRLIARLRKRLFGPRARP